MPNFMISMYENDNAWRELAPEEQDRLLRKYYAWVEELRESGAFKAGAPLASEGRVLKLVDGEVVDGPFSETKEVMTGYFIVDAPDLAAASRLAEGCPGLEHGETVIVRGLDDD